MVYFYPQTSHSVTRQLIMYRTNKNTLVRALSGHALSGQNALSGIAIVRYRGNMRYRAHFPGPIVPR